MPNDITPEFSDFQEIDERVRDAGEAGLKIASVKVLKSVTHAIVNTRLGVSALQGAVSRIGERIVDLDRSINTASGSSENLSRAIKNATWTAAAIAALGVLVAAATLGWDVYKTVILGK